LGVGAPASLSGRRWADQAEIVKGHNFDCLAVDLHLIGPLEKFIELEGVKLRDDVYSSGGFIRAGLPEPAIVRMIQAQFGPGRRPRKDRAVSAR
jgi:hypothetical protein